MTTGNDHSDAVVALLSSLLGRVEARDMFGAVGLYLDGAQFGVMSDGRLLFRADHLNRGDYEDYRQPDEDGFCARADLPGDLPWRPVPGPVLDDPETLRDWALKAWEAAKRARKAGR